MKPVAGIINQTKYIINKMFSKNINRQVLTRNATPANIKYKLRSVTR